MALAVLYEIPDSPIAFQTWAFANAAHHRDIIRLIYARDGNLISEPVLDPFNPLDSDNMQSWLQQHQDLHQAQNAALGIAGYNLSEVDWRDPGQLTAWIYFHADEHYQAGTILNLG